MKTLLLTALAWISKVPSSTINELFSTATDIVASNDNQSSSISGWEKLRTSVEYLITLLPADEKYKAVASIVVTIIVNVALLVVRLKGSAK